MKKCAKLYGVTVKMYQVVECHREDLYQVVECHREEECYVVECHREEVYQVLEYHREEVYQAVHCHRVVVTCMLVSGHVKCECTSCGIRTVVGGIEPTLISICRYGGSYAMQAAGKT